MCCLKFVTILINIIDQMSLVSKREVDALVQVSSRRRAARVSYL